MFNPFSNFPNRPIQGGTSFVDHFGDFCLFFSLSYCLFCLLQPYGHLLGKGWPLGSLVFDIVLCFVTFPYGVFGQVLNLIISIPEFCPLPYF